MFESRPSRRELGLTARLALLAGLALTPKAAGSEDAPPPRAAQSDPSSVHENERARTEALRRHIALSSITTPETPTVQTELAQPSAEQIGRESVAMLVSDGDIQAFLANPSGNADTFSEQALDDVLGYRDSRIHSATTPTLDARRTLRQQANNAIAQEMQRRITDTLSGAHGGTMRQQQELAVALSTAFSMMFDSGHRTLHEYSLGDGDAFLDTEPACVTLSPEAIGNPSMTEDELDADDHPDTETPEDELDPGLEDPEEEPLDPPVVQR